MCPQVIQLEDVLAPTLTWISEPLTTAHQYEVTRRVVCTQVIQLEEVLAPPAPPPVRVNYTDLDLSSASLNPSPVVPRPVPAHEPATDYAVIDYAATSAAAQAGRDHVRLREKLDGCLSRTPSVASASPHQQ